jgi:hypothetical protein
MIRYSRNHQPDLDGEIGGCHQPTLKVNSWTEITEQMDES